MPYSCCAVNCKGNYRGGPKVSVFSFPKDPDLCRKWILHLRRRNFEPTSNSKVCQLHFRKEDIVTEVEGFDEKYGRLLRVSLERPRLKKDALPIPFPERASDLQSFTSPAQETENEKRARAKLAANWKRDTSEENNESVEPFTNETRRDNATNETTPLRNECQSSNENAKKRKVTGFEAELLDLIKKRKSQITNDETDDDKAFLMSLLPTLKKFDDDQKLTVRIEIMNAIRRVQFNQQPALSSPRSPPRPVIIRAPSASPPLEFPLYAIKTSPKSPPSQDEYGSEYDRSSMQGAIVPSTSNYLQGSYGTNSPSLSDTTDRVSIKDEDTSVSNYDY